MLFSSILLCSFVVFVMPTKDEDGVEQLIKYSRPLLDGSATYFLEPFHSVEEFETKWKPSNAKKDGVEESIAKYDAKWGLTEPKESAIIGDHGLTFLSEAKHGAISSPLQKIYKFEDRSLLVQYEVRFQKKHECGGAYVKLLADTEGLKFEEFHDKTEYTIMFGPDKCGGDGKLHFIFQHKNPITHKMEEKHAKKPTGEFNNIFEDGKTHLVGLILRPDNTFEIQVDQVVVNAGSLLKDMEPPINPPKMIDDPTDLKPDDWDEREKIPDPNASKPENWDEDAQKMISDPNAVKPDGWLDEEPEMTADPASVKPQDWDEEEDGEWEAPQVPNPKCKAVGCGVWSPPQIKNPEYKGKWSPPLIKNPSYKGIWSPKQVENPNYFEDNSPFTMKSIAAVGFELWSMQSDIVFDNIIIADELDTVQQWTQQTWNIKHSKELASETSNISGMFNSFMNVMKEKPWLWAVIAVAVILINVVIYFLCCRKVDKTAIQKKTDEVVPDDDDVQEVNEKEVTLDENVSEKTEVKSEENDNTADESDKSADVEEIPSSKEEVEDPNKQDDEKDVPADIPSENVDEESTPEEIPQSSPKTRAARRKTRKES